MLQVYDSNMQTVLLKCSGEGTEESPAVLSVSLESSLEATAESLSDFTTIDSTLRVGSVTNLGDYKQIIDKDVRLFDEAVGGSATSVYEAVNGGVRMSVAADGDYVIRQTKAVHNYTSGNPHIFEQTVIDMAPVSGVVKEMGYYSSSSTAPYDAEIDGFVLQTDDTTIHLKVVKGGTDIFSAAQADWDDPLDGTGPSGIVVNPAMFNVLIGEFLYLGGTVFRAGMIVGSRVRWFHTFKNSNFKPSTFVLSPNQPLRWSIRSTGGSGSMVHVCGKVGSIGKVESVGVATNENNKATHVNANTIGTSYVLIGVKPNNKRRPIRPAAFGGLAGTADQYLLEVRLNPTVAGAISFTDSGNGYDSAVGAADGSNTVTGGIVLDAMYVEGKGSAVLPLSNLLRPGYTIDGVADTVILCVTPLGANLDVYGSIQTTVQP